MLEHAERVKQSLQGGLIPAVPVPRYADGRIHDEAQAAYASYLARQNIAGVAVWAHTGRGCNCSRGSGVIFCGCGDRPWVLLELSLPGQERCLILL